MRSNRNEHGIHPDLLLMDLLLLMLLLVLPMILQWFKIACVAVEAASRAATSVQITIRIRRLISV